MPRRIQVNTGDRYGRLTVIEEIEPYHAPCGQSYRRFNCVCDCGKKTQANLSSMRTGGKLSCGCLQRELAAISGHNNATHGMDGKPTYRAWASIKQRCFNPNHQYYDYYGGRGISMCKRWLDSFENFLEDMGEKPDGLTLDRIDNDGDYEPGNCRWATRAEQNRNMRRNRLLTLNGETLCIAEWSRRTGISRCAIHGRLRAGLSVKDALTIPAGIRKLSDYAK